MFEGWQQGLACVCVPHPRRPVFGSGDHALTIRAELGEPDRTVVPKRRSNRFATARVPNLRGSICRRRDDKLPIRTELGKIDRTSMDQWFREWDDEHLLSNI
jgi:hypothetical protein